MVPGKFLRRAYDTQYPLLWFEVIVCLLVCSTPLGMLGEHRPNFILAPLKSIVDNIFKSIVDRNFLGNFY